MAKTELTAQALRELLIYEPQSGEFRWKRKRSGVPDISRQAGNLDRLGYRQITVSGKAYLAHRLAWLYVHGQWPDGEIDHVNRAKDDNRLCNLRVATRAENCQNKRAARSDSTTGYQGVTLNGRKYAASITVHGKRHYLGTFNTPAEAGAAYAAVKPSMHQSAGC